MTKKIIISKQISKWKESLRVWMIHKLGGHVESNYILSPGHVQVKVKYYLNRQLVDMNPIESEELAKKKISESLINRIWEQELIQFSRWYDIKPNTVVYCADLIFVRH